ncbi:hypothetical protein XcodCFBP4690_02610 [Xanthomonas codiaei]|uniref:Uncharacterized protein n=1 Tax=Xanthomonas codiaei TaxID=56463 RepID=A0A2S7CWI6_9XANT|nr:hypothetical protein XcodCFBP4690_02610 [Xanthomonas codiaei]
MDTDYRDWSLPAHRRGTFGGMDAAKELTWTYLQRVLRWWAGKGPAAWSQISAPQPISSRAIHAITPRRARFPSQSWRHIDSAQTLSASCALCPRKNRILIRCE